MPNDLRGGQIKNPRFVPDLLDVHWLIRLEQRPAGQRAFVRVGVYEMAVPFGDKLAPMRLQERRKEPSERCAVTLQRSQWPLLPGLAFPPQTEGLELISVCLQVEYSSGSANGRTKTLDVLPSKL
jgi:hypothetical protein